MIGVMPGPWMTAFEVDRRQAEHHGHHLEVVSDGRNGAYGHCEACGLSLHFGHEVGGSGGMRWLNRSAARGGCP